jgi:hypothetical protein
MAKRDVLLGIVLCLGLIMGVVSCGPGEEPSSLLRICSDQDCTQPISVIDFGAIPLGYSRGVIVPVYISNRSTAQISVTGDDDGSLCCPGYVTLDAAPPKFYSEREIAPGESERFHILLDITGTPSPQTCNFRVTITAEGEDGLSFSRVFPAKVTILKE